MANVITIGVYLPGQSLMHRLDARVKFTLLICYITGLFCLNSWLGIMLFAALLLLGFVVARVPLKLALRMLVPLVAILAFTLVANAFGSDIVSIRPPDLLPWIELHPESMVYFFSPLIGGFGFRLYGLLRGLFLVLRIVLMVMATSLLTYTSQMVALSEAFVSMLRPLAVFKVPIEDIAMVFSITLRFIMLTASETERMMVAQQARGAVFDQGGPIKRGQAWIPVLIPLFVKLFRRADNLAAAMETRCYRGHGRTHLRTNKLKPQVLIAALIASALLIAVGIVL